MLTELSGSPQRNRLDSSITNADYDMLHKWQTGEGENHYDSVHSPLEVSILHTMPTCTTVDVPEFEENGPVYEHIPGEK